MYDKVINDLIRRSAGRKDWERLVLHGESSEKSDLWDAKILQVPAVQKEFYDRKNRVVEERIESLTTKKGTFERAIMEREFKSNRSKERDETIKQKLKWWKSIGKLSPRVYFSRSK